MKRFLLMGCAVGCLLSATAQTKDHKIQQTLDDVKNQLIEFNTERKLDSLDQDKLPRLVSGGVLAGANLSNFIITRDHHTMSSYMKVGGELGGFLDFTITRHFAVQPQVMFTAQQNRFAVREGADVYKQNYLWSFGVDIPIYFLGRFGNLDKGYIQFGGGIFTHFTFASNIANKYKNVDDETPAPAAVPSKTETTVVTYDYSRLYSLHNNHFGVCAMVGYEFSFGMQINAQYKVSLSDVAGFYSEMKGQAVADALIYPQSVSLNIGYRWR